MLKKGLETSYEDSNRCKHSKPANQNANPKCKGIGELTLLDFLEQAEGKNQNLADKQIALAGGGTLKFTILTSGGYGVQIQSQGRCMELRYILFRDVLPITHVTVYLHILNL